MRSATLALALACLCMCAARAAAAACGPLPAPANGAVETCTLANSQTGDVCTVSCGAGYKLQGEAARRCDSTGTWVGDTTLSTSFSCVPSACLTMPCNMERSTCKDLPDTYQCKCLPGFAGTPGTDGEGCKFQASITTEDNGNLIVEVDPSKAVVFKRGSVSHAVHTTWQTLALLTDSTASLSISITSLQENIELQVQTSLGVLDTRISTVSEALPTQMSSLKSEISAATASVYATKADVSTDIATALENAKQIEAQANERIMQDLTDIISNLAEQQGDQHGAQNVSIAALELAVIDMETRKVNKADMEAGFVANRGKLPTEADIGSCTAQLLGQMRFNTQTRVVEVCSNGNAFSLITFDPPGSVQYSPATSCQELVNAGYSSGSGKYWIKENHWTYSAHHYCVMPTKDGETAVDIGGNGLNENGAAHSCRTAMDLFGQTTSGAYFIRTVDGPQQTYCDMERNGGGWTLMVTSTTNTWTMQSIVKRGTPSVTSDFSFLKYGDDIKESTVVAGTTFEYRLEANQFGHWGGIWKAPRHYPLVSDYNFLTSVQLTTKFDNWEYSDAGIEQRLPYMLGASAALTTSGGAQEVSWWGTIAATQYQYVPAPWISPSMENPGKIWYWIREEPIDLTRRHKVHTYGLSPDAPGTSCADIKSNSPDEATELGIYFVKGADGKPTRRLCHMARSPVLDLGGDGTTVNNAAMSCRVLYDYFAFHHPSLSNVFYLKPAAVAFATYCDFAQGSGWALLVLSVSSSWTTASAQQRGSVTTSFDTDFSVLSHANSIKDHAAVVAGSQFEYRIHGASLRGDGGTWSAPRSYTFTSTSNAQTQITKVVAGPWTYSSMDERMPYLGPACGTLTTASNPVLTWWGTIVTTAECAGYFPAAYLPASGPYGKIFYLMREGPLAL